MEQCLNLRSLQIQDYQFSRMPDGISQGRIQPTNLTVYHCSRRSNYQSSVSQHDYGKQLAEYLAPPYTLPSGHSPQDIKKKNQFTRLSGLMLRPACKLVKAHANERNKCQQLPTLLWLHANGRNKSQHCWAQQCWVSLANSVGSVSMGLKV